MFAIISISYFFVSICPPKKTRSWIRQCVYHVKVFHLNFKKTPRFHLIHCLRALFQPGSLQNSILW